MGVSLRFFSVVFRNGHASSGQKGRHQVPSRAIAMASPAQTAGYDEITFRQRHLDGAECTLRRGDLGLGQIDVLPGSLARGMGGAHVARGQRRHRQRHVAHRPVVHLLRAVVTPEGRPPRHLAEPLRIPILLRGEDFQISGLWPPPSAAGWVLKPLTAQPERSIHHMNVALALHGMTSTPVPRARTVMTAQGSYYDDWHASGVAASRAVVFVHGLGGSRAHFADTASRMSTDVRVLALDLPGFGDSPLVDDGSRRAVSVVDQHVQAIDDVIRHAGVNEAILGGHSMGGPLALRFTERSGDRVAAIALICATVHTFQATLARRWSPWRLAPGTAFATTAEVLMAATPVPQPLVGRLAASKLGRRATLWPFVHRPGALRSADAATIIAGSGSPGVLPMARALGKFTDWERPNNAARLPPLHAINGRWDRIAPLSDLARFPLPLQSTETLDAGHMVMLEAPDAFVAAMHRIVSVT